MEIDLITLIVIGVLSAVGGAFSGVLGAIRVLPKLWIKSKFNKDFEHFKIKNLHEFDFLLSQRTKWHEKEIEVLTQIWKNLASSKSELNSFTNLIEYNRDLDKMDEEELEIFFKDEEMTDFDKKRLMKEKNKNGKFGDAYSEVFKGRALRETTKALLNSKEYFELNKIFLKSHIKEKIEKAHHKILYVMVVRATHEPTPNADSEKEPYKMFINEVAPLVDEIEKIIQEALFPEEQQDN